MDGVVNNMDGVMNNMDGVVNNMDDVVNNMDGVMNNMDGVMNNVMRGWNTADDFWRHPAGNRTTPAGAGAGGGGAGAGADGDYVFHYQIRWPIWELIIFSGIGFVITESLFMVGVPRPLIVLLTVVPVVLVVGLPLACVVLPIGMAVVTLSAMGVVVPVAIGSSLAYITGGIIAAVAARNARGFFRWLLDTGNTVSDFLTEINDIV